MLVQQVGNMTVFSVASVDLLADFEGVTFTGQTDTVEGSSVIRAGDTPIGVKLSGTFETTLLSMKSSPDRVSHLDLSVLSLGGTSYLGQLKSVDFSGGFKRKKQGGAGAWWTKPQNIKKNYAATVNLDVLAGDAADFFALQFSTTAADRYLAFLATINGVSTTVPMFLEKTVLGVQRDDLQSITLSLSGRDPGTGNYPTAPTGTTGLLAKAFNAPFSEMAFSFTSGAAAVGVAITGNCIFDTFSFNVSDEGLVNNKYSFLTYGAASSADAS